MTEKVSLKLLKKNTKTALRQVKVNFLLRRRNLTVQKPNIMQVLKNIIQKSAYHGVKIYRFTPGLLHGKTVLADREAAFVGSVNMDYRSFQLHFECGTLLYGAPALETLLEDMDGIMEKSWQVTRSVWEHRRSFHSAANAPSCGPGAAQV